ncbi:MAG TPA: PspC domain-containing protein [Candidatus Limnocylindrales bacterium]
MNSQSLYRSTDDRIISGVAGGMADYLDMDPSLVRVIWAISFFVTGSITFWIYLVLMVVLPAQPAEWPQQSPWAPGGAPVGGQEGGSVGGVTGWAASYAPPAAGATSDATPGTIPGADPDATLRGTPPSAAGQTGWWSGDRRDRRHQERWQRRQERWQQRFQDREYHSYGGPGIVFGLMLVLVGGLLAWHQFDANFDLGSVWPIAIIAFGGILVLSSFRFRNS